jgi:hypothetical protein
MNPFHFILEVASNRFAMNPLGDDEAGVKASALV